MEVQLTGLDKHAKRVLVIPEDPSQNLLIRHKVEVDTGIRLSDLERLVPGRFIERTAIQKNGRVKRESSFVCWIELGAHEYYIRMLRVERRRMLIWRGVVKRSEIFPD